MKSKPVYTALELDPSARRHVFLTQGPEGQKAVWRVLFSHPAVNASLLALDDPANSEAKLEDALAEAGMGTAFYIAGPEAFLWQMTSRLRRSGVENPRIRQELAGSAARRVYCVHCRTLNEQVKTTTHRCTACGLNLTVRDHFSRPLQAYMGVIADAEPPGAELTGDVPKPEMAYL